MSYRTSDFFLQKKKTRTSDFIIGELKINVL